MKPQINDLITLDAPDNPLLQGTFRVVGIRASQATQDKYDPSQTEYDIVPVKDQNPERRLVIPKLKLNQLLESRRR
jgi:hypothetical protein